MLTHGGFQVTAVNSAAVAEYMNIILATFTEERAGTSPAAIALMIDANNYTATARPGPIILLRFSQNNRYTWSPIGGGLMPNLSTKRENNTSTQ
jgi:hypothetical protein